MAQQQQQHEAGGENLRSSPVFMVSFSPGLKSTVLRLTIQSELSPRVSYYQYYSQASELHSELMSQRDRKKIKTLSMHKQDRHHADVLPICETIKSCLPNLETLVIRRTRVWNDQDLAMLFEHLPSTFLSLDLEFLSRPIPLSFQQIPQSFPNLKELNLDDCRSADHNAWPNESFAGLGNMLRAMPTLQKLTMEDVVCQSATDWNPVLEAIYDHSNLINLRFVTPEQKRHPLESMTNFRFGSEVEDRVMSVLRIRRLIKENVFVSDYMSMGNIDKGDFALKTWTEAVVASRYNVDCLDHLFSNFDPSIFAKAAIRGLRGPCKRRAWWLENTDEGRTQRHSELTREKAEAEVAAERRIREKGEVFLYPRSW